MVEFETEGLVAMRFSSRSASPQSYRSQKRACFAWLLQVLAPAAVQWRQKGRSLPPDLLLRRAPPWLGQYQYDRKGSGPSCPQWKWNPPRGGDSPRRAAGDWSDGCY